MKLFVFSILASIFASASPATIRNRRQTWQEPFPQRFQSPNPGFPGDSFNLVFDFQDGNDFAYPDYGPPWTAQSGNNSPNGDNWLINNNNNRPNGVNWSNNNNDNRPNNNNNRPNNNNNRPNNNNNRPNGVNWLINNNRPNGVNWSNNNNNNNNNRPGNNRPNGFNEPGNNRPNNNAGPGNRPNGNFPARPGNNRPNNNNNNNNAGSGNVMPNGNARPGNNRPQMTSPATTTSSTTERGSTPRTFHLTPEGCDCPFTPQFNPVCGTDGNTYKNSGLLQCFRRCGIDVNQRRMGAC